MAQRQDGATMTKRVQLEERIEATPARTIRGVGIKLAIFADANDHDDAASCQAMSDLRDCVALLGS